MDFGTSLGSFMWIGILAGLLQIAVDRPCDRGVAGHSTLHRAKRSRLCGGRTGGWRAGRTRNEHRALHVRVVGASFRPPARLGGGGRRPVGPRSGRHRTSGDPGDAGSVRPDGTGAPSARPPHLRHRGGGVGRTRRGGHPHPRGLRHPQHVLRHAVRHARDRCGPPLDQGRVRSHLRGVRRLLRGRVPAQHGHRRLQPPHPRRHVDRECPGNQARNRQPEPLRDHVGRHRFARIARQRRRNRRPRGQRQRIRYGGCDRSRETPRRPGVRQLGDSGRAVRRGTGPLGRAPHGAGRARRGLGDHRRPEQRHDRQHRGCRRGDREQHLSSVLGAHASHRHRARPRPVPGLRRRGGRSVAPAGPVCRRDRRRLHRQP